MHTSQKKTVINKSKDVRNISIKEQTVKKDSPNSLETPLTKIEPHITDNPRLPKLVKQVLEAFDELYPEPKCGLEESDPFGLLVATILSAQCTDLRVNLVAPILLSAYKDPLEMSKAPIKSIEDIIKSCGFYHMKAKNIKACSKALLDNFSGKVPQELDKLITLPGVGRKTANCVMGNAFGLPGITVDTHVGRVSRRLGLTVNTDPTKVEADLASLLPKESWTRFSHQGIAHGRALCRSQKPLCETCPLSFCPYPKSFLKTPLEAKKFSALDKKSPSKTKKR